MKLIDRDIVDVVGEKGIVYQRELQVYLEDKYSHWDVYNRLRYYNGDNTFVNSQSCVSSPIYGWTANVRRGS